MYLLDQKSYNIIDQMLPENLCLCHAVTEHILDGEIYVDNEQRPESYFIRNRSGSYYVGGNPANQMFREQLASYLRRKENHTIYYDLYASSKDWIDSMEKELGDDVVRLGRINFEYDDSLTPYKITMPDNFRFVPLDEQLYEKYVAEVDDSYGMIYTSAQDFIKNSFGFGLMYRNQFISTCNGYHISRETAEVDVWTDKNYRNNGYATYVVNEFVKECKKRRLTAVWNADKGNAASIHLAIKCGFQKTYEEDELWWHIDKRQIEQYLRRYRYLE